MKLLPHEREQHPTMSDVIVTVPSLNVIKPLCRWRPVAFAAVFELKSFDSDDPMVNNMITHWKTLVPGQLANGTRNITPSRESMWIRLYTRITYYY